MKRIYSSCSVAGTLALSMLFASTTLPAHAQDAAALYKSKCAMCHGTDGKGNTAAGKSTGAHDFASPEVQKQSDADLEQIMKNGKNKMPGYAGKLKESEIKDLVAYVRQLGKGK
jgi:mono/diheme cytochrome c family protein